MTGDVGRLEAVTVDPRRWLGLGIVLLAVFMDLVDITIVLIAARRSRPISPRRTQGSNGWWPQGQDLRSRRVGRRAGSLSELDAR